MDSIRISPQDNVAVALHPLSKGGVHQGATLLEDIQQGPSSSMAIP